MMSSTEWAPAAMKVLVMRGIGVRGVGKTDTVLDKRTHADPSALGRDQRLDLTLVDTNRELGPARDIDLGILGATRFAAREHALADRVHCRIAPPGTTPVPPTVSSEIRMVG